MTPFFWGRRSTSERLPERDAALPAEPPAGMDARCVVLVSDTHGRISDALREQLADADLIVHAGDITSESDFEELCCYAPVRAVLGNNDGYYDYGPDVVRVNEFTFEGVRFAVAHYQEDLPTEGIDVAVCGHTHRAKVVEAGSHLLVNPGSASYPRGERGATVARLYVADGRVVAVRLVDIER